MEKASRCLICDSHSHNSRQCHDLYNTHVEGSKSDQDQDDDALPLYDVNLTLQRNLTNSIGQSTDSSTVMTLNIPQLCHLIRSH